MNLTNKFSWAYPLWICRPGADPRRTPYPDPVLITAWVTPGWKARNSSFLSNRGSFNLIKGGGGKNAWATYFGHISSMEARIFMKFEANVHKILLDHQPNFYKDSLLPFRPKYYESSKTEYSDSTSFINRLTPLIFFHCFEIFSRA